MQKSKERRDQLPSATVRDALNHSGLRRLDVLVSSSAAFAVNADDCGDDDEDHQRDEDGYEQCAEVQFCRGKGGQRLGLLLKGICLKLHPRNN